MAIEVRKFDAPLGAEIIGVDCAGDLSDALIGEIEEAWYDNLLVVFRNQELEDDRLMAFTRRFGEPDTEGGQKHGHMNRNRGFAFITSTTASSSGSSLKC